MEWESDSPCHSHTYPREGCRSPRGRGGWELEFEDCGAIPAWGLLLTVERWTKGMWGRRVWREMPVEGGRAAREARWYSRVTRSGWCHHHSLSLHARIGSWTIERLAHQTPEAPKYRADSSQAGPSMCLMPWTTEKDPRQWSHLSVWMGGATEKDWPKRPSDPKLQEAWKTDSYRAITPVVEAVHAPAHLALPGSLKAKQLRHLHAQFLLGQNCHRQKTSCIYVHRVTLVVSDSLPPCRPWPARLLGQGGGLSRKEYWNQLANTGCHTLLEHYISCFPNCKRPWVLGAARTPETQAAAPPPHLALTGANPSPPGQPQEQTPVDDPYAEVKIKLQLKPRGSVTKEEDPKPSRQLYNLQIKSTGSTRQTLSMEYIKGHWELPQKKIH